MSKSTLAIVVAMSFLLGGQWVSAGNIPSWGNASTTNQPQVQQPVKPLVSQPAANTARTVQPSQPRSWTPPGTASSPTVSTPQQPGSITGTGNTQPVVSPRNPRVRPRTNIYRRNAPAADIGTRQTGPVGTKTQWAHWSELAWDATKMAVNSFWIPQATIQNVQIMAVSAICQAMCLSGPDIGPQIRSFSLSNGVPTEIADVFANSMAGAWKDWQNSVTIPGLPWYPAFAAFPGPQAPPTPNIPTPLVALTARNTELTSSSRLADRVFAQINGADIPTETRDEITRFTQQWAIKFQIWLSSAMVTNVMGQGPVPTFAPPVVPVGPVVGGSVISAPGVITGNLR